MRGQSVFLSFFFVAISLNLFAAPKARPEFEFVQNFVEKYPDASQDELLQALKKNFPKLFIDPALMFRSESSQKDGVSAEFPRAILSSQDGEFLLAFTGDSRKAEFGAIEMIQMRKPPAGYQMAEVVKDGGQLKLTTNPARCISCHGDPARPIWEAYDLWPGAYFGENSNHHGNFDRKKFQDFIQGNRQKGRYALLDLKIGNYYLEALDEKERKLLTPAKLAELKEQDRLGAHTGAESTAPLLNTRLSPAHRTYAYDKIMANNDFAPYRAAFIAASFQCADFAKWLPPSKEWKSDEAYTTFVERMEGLRREKLLTRKRRANQAIGNNIEVIEIGADGFDTKDFAPAFWVLQLGGLSYDQFTLSFDRKDPATLMRDPFVSFPFSVAAEMAPASETIEYPIGGGDKDSVYDFTGDIIIGKVKAWKGGFGELENEDDKKIHAEACASLDRALAKQGYKASNSTTSPVAPKPVSSVAPVGELCLASRFTVGERVEIERTIASCQRCHAVGKSADAPDLGDFRSRSFAERLSKKATINTKHADLLEDIIDRMYSTDPDVVMPPGSPMSNERKALFKRYVNACKDSLDDALDDSDSTSASGH